MLALSPSCVYPTTFSWPSEEQLAPLNVESFNGDFSYHGDPHISQPFFQVSSENTESEQTSNVKKLTHNANERDRRKKLNSLYSSLRSLLPESEQGKRMSIPTTVTRVLKYIPELQKEVDSLIQRREEILARAPVQDNHRIPNANRGNVQGNSVPRITICRLDEGEMMVQICASKMKRGQFSKILIGLEEEGLMATDASSFSIGGHGVVYNLLLQVKEGFPRLDCEVLKDKILWLCRMSKNP
ncbi:transcription factor ORG2 [Amborella trichopoda]|uniref:BHLH domain-containing protein n=1 Tax=Amborella trichopoda TaxID=13333 RepID=U5D7C2_AMBTC|nr:transcription factor ORG2 [Amborella trichopoda]ERN16263.1 hypothetical protein AMTR_s00063p00154030 [Amborella trichopoda]|eukprot:XP_006854796.1 transcription factor ORG2 [Amborella trichopoda]